MTKNASFTKLGVNINLQLVNKNFLIINTWDWFNFCPTYLFCIHAVMFYFLDNSFEQSPKHLSPNNNHAPIPFSFATNKVYV